MFLHHFDEMTDESVTAELVPGNRVRIAYGRSVVLSLEIGEAVDLVAAVIDALAQADHESQSKLRRDEDHIRAAANVREALQ